MRTRRGARVPKPRDGRGVEADGHREPSRPPLSTRDQRVGAALWLVALVIAALWCAALVFLVRWLL